MTASAAAAMVRHQTWVGVGAFLTGGLMAYGAAFISADAGYAGIGPNALPWLVATVLMLCGLWLIWEARSGGYREMELPSGAPEGDWRAAAFVIAGVVANAALITVIGFILACSLCFALAVRGLRMSEGKAGGGPRQSLLDGLTGLIIAAPVFWLFTKVLAINLPGLTTSGWL
ncbi:tripartite tricarboxylate transporter TctB family protein [Roseateles oligotrophus]|uniref:Tripartite tricarboxylate transporter TctB family protein n=1 Tax=Roseateles oligotrophus TaxID=1769250 RepID=A0ABT2Y949_9BURK|nr:tripartite tricarboxylate transporter TctB family protein [Roseateles oligotrophus]MCV2366824.1 tripartite tricarboxylate transporter TctB family protein [Roseateles oligotrophus]